MAASLIAQFAPRVLAYAFHHSASTMYTSVNTLTLLHCLVSSRILHPTQLLGVTLHGLKASSFERRGLVCATAVVVRQWTLSVLHGPSDLSAAQPSSLCNTDPMTHHCSSSCTLSVWCDCTAHIYSCFYTHRHLTNTKHVYQIAESAS